jgi:hypothetical protein
MEMEQAAKHLMQSAEKPVSMPSEEQLRVITKWVGMFMELNHKEISELGMAAYIEGLKDLSVAQIEYGCERALKEVDHMPTVAHIRQRITEYTDSPITNVDRGCEACRWTGWKLVRRTDGPGEVARRCECTKP